MIITWELKKKQLAETPSLFISVFVIIPHGYDFQIMVRDSAFYRKAKNRRGREEKGGEGYNIL